MLQAVISGNKSGILANLLAEAIEYIAGGDVIAAIGIAQQCACMVEALEGRQISHTITLSTDN
jgi:hypothetical protein